MTDGTDIGIVVEKTLHLENAFVRSMAYTSLERPALNEIAEVGGRQLVRVSRDNGRTWTAKGERTVLEEAGDRAVEKCHPVYHVDPDNGILVEFCSEHEMRAGQNYSFGPDATEELLQFRTSRIFYRFSADEGETWGPRKQLIQKGPEYDEVHWADGIRYGVNSGGFDELLRVTKLSDGTLIVPIHLNRADEDGKLVKLVDRFGEVVWPLETVATFRGRWRDDHSDIDWEMSNAVTTPEYMSHGLSEPCVAEMNDGVLMMVLRGCASARQTMPGVKFFCTSKDQGGTWGPVVPLTYPDGGLVYSPSSFPSLFRSSKNDKVYLIANILPGPTRQSDPRFPLQIAEVDKTYFWVLPETVTVIDDRRPEHPELVRFSNWQRIEDRETGNPVIFMSESRCDAIIPYADGTVSPHAYRYEIKLADGG